MNEMQVFKNSEFGEIGVITINGREYFPATACAKILGYADPHKAVKQHTLKEGWVIRPVIDSMGRTQQTKFIHEGNLYRLITHSKLPAAEKFERWVFDEVLPAIRKQGYYSTRDELPMDKVTEIIQQTAVAIARAILETKNYCSSTVSVEPPRRRKSFGKVDKLPDTYREAVEQMLEDGFSYREITEFLAQRGHIMSQMAIHTYAMRA